MLALAEHESLFGRTLAEQCSLDEATGEVLPVVTIVTDNGGPFRSFRFEAFIAAHPELVHVRTRVRAPGQNGSRERGFGTLKYERLFIDDIADAVELAERAEHYRLEYNAIRPHQAIAWNRPKDVHLGLADPTVPTFEPQEILPTT
jgi:transposase InsO family protein